MTVAVTAAVIDRLFADLKHAPLPPFQLIPSAATVVGNAFTHQTNRREAALASHFKSCGHLPLAFSRCPLYPNNQTFSCAFGMSVKCQQRTFGERLPWSLETDTKLPRMSRPGLKMTKYADPCSVVAIWTHNCMAGVSRYDRKRPSISTLHT
jgi:hypothetical protein